MPAPSPLLGLPSARATHRSTVHYYQRGQNRFGEEIFEAREKGIDVCVAVDIAMGAMRDEYDVCVLFSGDTDLLPALEAVLDLGKRCEVVAWQPRGVWTPRLNVPGKQLWCHWLDEEDYQRLHDPSDYTQALPPPVADP